MSAAAAPATSIAGEVTLKRAATALLMRLANAYPTSAMFSGQRPCANCGHDSGDAAIEQYRNDLLALMAECGAERVEQGVLRGIRFGFRKEDGTVNRSFLPTVGEIAGMVDQVPHDRSSVPRVDPECASCGGTGWGLAVQAGAASPQSGDELGPRRVKRCACIRVRANV